MPVMYNSLLVVFQEGRYTDLLHNKIRILWSELSLCFSLESRRVERLILISKTDGCCSSAPRQSGATHKAAEG